MQRPAAAAPRAQAAAGAKPIVGIIAGIAGEGNQTMGPRLRRVQTQTHATWLREDFNWNQIEPRPGQFSFAHYDRFMLLAAQRHEHVLALMFSSPTWAASTPTTLPADPSGYAGFVAAVVGRYGPGGTFWAAHPTLGSYAISTFDLWNEPYYEQGNGGHYNPAQYVAMVKAAVTAGRAANPAAKFLIEAEMASAQQNGNWVWWVDALYQAAPDLNNYFDGVSVHPYGHDIVHRSPALAGHPYNGYDQMRRIEVVHQQFINHGAGSKPFWATEVGWPTCKRGSVRCVSPHGQARSLRTLLRYARTIWSGYVHAVFVYTYKDRPSAGASRPEADYGLTRANHRPKPALAIFRRAAIASSAGTWFWP